MPVAPAESVLRHLLTGAKAVEGCAAAEPAAPQPVMDRAAEISAQVRARLAGPLVDRELRRNRERWRHTAQPEAATAVRLQLDPARRGGGCGWIAFCPQCLILSDPHALS